MIVSFRHSGLKLLYTKGYGRKLPTKYLNKIVLILNIIDNLDQVPQDLSFYKSLRPHVLKGDLKDFWSLDVSANFRIIFKFSDGDAYDLDYIDTH